MTTTRSLRTGTVAALVIASIVLVMALINVDYGAPWGTRHTLRIDAAQADGIASGSDVRVAGRSVGQVMGATSHGDYAQMDVVITSGPWPLSSDTRAAVRIASLLGQRYIELYPGTASTTLGENAELRTPHVADVVDFDQVLNTFDAPTRDSLTSTVRTLGAPSDGGLAGQQDVLQALIPDASALSADSQAPTAVLKARDAQLASILTNLATSADTLAASRVQLAGVITHLNSVMSALAENQGALRSFVRDTDSLNVTTHAVLGAGGAAQLNAALQRLPVTTARLDVLLRTLLPQSRTFRDTAYPATLDLIAEIGDATSQSDSAGYFLRQNDAGIDLTGLTPPPPVPPSPSSAQPPSLPSLPHLPPLPLPLPSLPPLPGIPSATCAAPGATPAPATPTPLPGPGATPCPTPPPVCVLSICLTGLNLITTAPAAVNDLALLELSS